MLEFLKEKYHRGKPLSLFLIISHCPQSSQDHCCSESAEHFVDRLSEKGRQLVCQVVKLPQIMLDMCLMQEERNEKDRENSRNQEDFYAVLQVSKKYKTK